MREQKALNTEQSTGRSSFSRRNFLRVAGAGGAAASIVAAGAASASAAPASAPLLAVGRAAVSDPAAGSSIVEYPRLAIARLSELQTGQPGRANYPDAASPILILKLGAPVSDGVGPDGDIVAYSSFCTHQGCPVTWRSDVQILACPCHFSSFDPARGGMQVIGQATTNLPQVALEVDGDDLLAVGVRGLIWGRQMNLQFSA